MLPRAMADGADSVAPTVSNSVITSSVITDKGTTLGWNAATDDVTTQAYIEYKVVCSTAANIELALTAEQNGTVLKDWTPDITTYTVSGQTPNTIYYYNVLAKDAAGNETAYTMKQQNTLRGSIAVFGGSGNTELFLGGNYIELGISNWGNFGTEGLKPTGFRGTDGGANIGMSADFDGYNNGHDMPIDYFLPGDQEERFAVGYKTGTNTFANSNSALEGAMNMLTVVTNLSDVANGLLKAKAVQLGQVRWRLHKRFPSRSMINIFSTR